MKRAAIAITFTLACVTGVAEELDLTRQITEAIPKGFSGPVHLNQRPGAMSHIWLQLQPGTSCSVSLIEAAGQLDSVQVGRADEIKVFTRLTRDAQAKYQVVHIEEEPIEEGGGHLQSSWGGTRDWKDVRETWSSIPKARGLALLALSCVGSDAKPRLDALRAALEEIIEHGH